MSQLPRWSGPSWWMILLKIKSNGNTKYAKLHEATSVVSQLISRCKDEYQKYIASRLNYPKTNAKMYLQILKTFYDGKKLMTTPPFLINNMLISDYEI